MIRLGALWKPKDTTNVVLSGTINNDTRIVILRNKHKKAENHPDFYVFLAENEKEKTAQSKVVPSVNTFADESDVF